MSDTKNQLGGGRPKSSHRFGDDSGTGDDDRLDRIAELEEALDEIRGIVAPPVTSPELARRKVEEICDALLEET